MIIIFILYTQSYSQDSTAPESKPIIFVSDTQTPLWIEKLFLDYNNNENARRIIFNDILNQQPAAVFHMGDLVDLGFLDSSWETVDNFVTQLTQFKIPFFPVLGNHEIMVIPGLGEANFITRYPYYIRTGYAEQIEDIAVILLNSNFSFLSDKENRQQRYWYKEQLTLYQNDPTVSTIIVGCHHPPFTNSKIVSASEDVRNFFVPDFLNTDKCRLFISGHAHALEHFIVSGKHFMVIGGAGGLQHPLRSSEAEYNDQFQSEFPLRPFHYGELMPDPRPKMVIRWINQKTNRLEDGYTLFLDQTQPIVSIVK